MYYEEPYFAAIVRELDLIAICSLILSVVFVLAFFSILVKWIFDKGDDS